VQLDLFGFIIGRKSSFIKLPIVRIKIIFQIVKTQFPKVNISNKAKAPKMLRGFVVAIL
jgi:hypothetical protein